MSLYYKINTRIPPPPFPMWYVIWRKNILYTNGLHPLDRQTEYLGIAVLDPGPIVSRTYLHYPVPIFGLDTNKQYRNNSYTSRENIAALRTTTTF